MRSVQSCQESRILDESFFRLREVFGFPSLHRANFQTPSVLTAYIPSFYDSDVRVTDLRANPAYSTRSPHRKRRYLREGAVEFRIVHIRAGQPRTLS